MTPEVKLGIVAAGATVIGYALKFATDLFQSKKSGDVTWDTALLTSMKDQLTFLQSEVDDYRTRTKADVKTIRRLEKHLAEKIVQLDILEEGAIALPVPFWIKGADKKFVFANRAWGDLTGLDPEACIGKSNLDLIQLGLDAEIAREWDSGDDEAIEAKGRLVVVDERSPVPGGGFTIGRSGKWLVLARGVTDITRIYGIYIDSRMWHLEEKLLVHDLHPSEQT